MKTTIICRTTSKGRQSLYLNFEGEEFYLFSQDYRHSVRDFFSHGPVTLNQLFEKKRAHGSEAMLRTMKKVPMYIHFVEREYNISVLDKTIQKNSKKKQYAA